MCIFSPSVFFGTVPLGGRLREVRPDSVHEPAAVGRGHQESHLDRRLQDLPQQGLQLQPQLHHTPPGGPHFTSTFQTNPGKMNVFHTLNSLYSDLLASNHANPSVSIMIPVFEAMGPLPRSMAKCLLSVPRSAEDLAMILARIPWLDMI